MSVPVGLRGEQKLEVITKAIELCERLLKAVQSEEMFPKRSRWLIASKIASMAEDIQTEVRMANRIRVVYADDYLYRRKLQMQADCHCEALLSLIENAHRILSIDSRKVENWVGLIKQLEVLISKWRESDRKRYGELLK